jgi:tRNA-dihydrouridine synthase B
MRTGWNEENKNAPTIAKIAEDHGIKMLAIHGRTRSQKYNGDAEYDTVKKNCRPCFNTCSCQW